MRRHMGFTLVEMMAVIVITAILLAIAMPSFVQLFERQRVKNAAEQLYGDLQYARSEAIQQNRNVTVTFGAGAAWCYIAHAASDACACSTSNAAGGSCTGAVVNNLKHVAGSDFRGVSLALPPSVGSMTFEPQRGMPVGAVGNTLITFSGTGNETLGIVVNSVGRVRLCAPDGSSLTGYSPCNLGS